MLIASRRKKRQFDFQPSMRDQGEEYTGTSLARFKRNFKKNLTRPMKRWRKPPDKTTYPGEWFG